MVATTTLKPSFRQQLQNNYPDFTFTDGKKFAFRPPKTIIIGPPEPNDSLLLLHELGHALSRHQDYHTHIERLKIETEAWAIAKKLCRIYHIPYDEDFVESQLDTYRDWLHSKSICKKCGLTRYQTPDGHYHCPLCDS
ncbi:hypothetical protein IJI55_01825 [Candidatus Saccharibacteria bacterium]|nr:hypothetical protein [Candidatus Saccharibacteria bacterium]